MNGNWTDWGSYSACSTTCGPGVQTRVCIIRIIIDLYLFSKFLQIRYCNNTNNFEELCIGESLDTAVCNENVSCPGLYNSILNKI